MLLAKRFANRGSISETRDWYLWTYSRIGWSLSKINELSNANKPKITPPRMMSPDFEKDSFHPNIWGILSRRTFRPVFLPRRQISKVITSKQYRSVSGASGGILAINSSARSRSQISPARILFIIWDFTFSQLSRSAPFANSANRL